MEQSLPIRVGSRVYLRNCIAGEPGMVTRLSKGKAMIYWPDMPELGRETTHYVDSLVIDQSFTIKQLGLAFDEVAA